MCCLISDCRLPELMRVSLCSQTHRATPERAESTPKLPTKLTQTLLRPPNNAILLLKIIVTDTKYFRHFFYFFLTVCKTAIYNKKSDNLRDYLRMYALKNWVPSSSSCRKTLKRILLKTEININKQWGQLREKKRFLLRTLFTLLSTIPKNI